MNSESLSTDIRKSYTYLILFYDGSFYYGVRLCPKGKAPWGDDKYVGSPITHKDKWNQIKYTKFILEVFNNYEDAQEAEKKLIKPHLNNPLCLNENIGGIISIKSKSRGGKISGRIAKESGQINRIRTKENCSKGGKIQGKRNVESGQIIELGKKWGKIAVESGQIFEISSKETRRKGGKTQGKRNVESGLLDSIRTKENCSKGGKIGGKIAFESGHLERICNFEIRSRGGVSSSSQRWKCLITGHISNAGPLTKYQKARGIDPSLRERIK